MISRELNIIYDSTTTLSTLYKGDNVRYKLVLDKDILGDCDTVNVNVYKPNGGITVKNSQIMQDGATWLILDALNEIGSYKILLWVKNKNTGSQMFYSTLVIEIKELIG